METTKIPLSSCIESKHQNRVGLGDVSGLARSIEVNGQITPLIVVADGDAYQLVAGHRRTAAMKSLGLEEADAYVMGDYDDVLTEDDAVAIIPILGTSVDVLSSCRDIANDRPHTCKHEAGR